MPLHTSQIRFIPTDATASFQADTEGAIYYDSDEDALMAYGTSWQKVAKTVVTGGTKTTDGSYTVRTFTSSGTLTVAGGSITCQILIAGGGGGGGRWGCGGGAGGLASNFIAGSDRVAAADDYTITIGAGGIGADGPSGGNTTTAFGETITGGGEGGSVGAGGEDGANGGGACAEAASDAAGEGTAPSVSADLTAYAGFDGGQGQPGAGANNHPGGGGGGATANGETPGSNTSSGGDGGHGKQINIDGNNYYWCGGGGGSAHNYGGSTRAGDGGNGGGGGGSKSYNGSRAGYGDTDGINNGENGEFTDPCPSGRCDGEGGDAGANTGGGGGGGSYIGYGGAGGSGIVIVRYLTP